MRATDELSQLGAKHSPRSNVGMKFFGPGAGVIRNFTLENIPQNRVLFGAGQKPCGCGITHHRVLCRDSERERHGRACPRPDGCVNRVDASGNVGESLRDGVTKAIRGPTVGSEDDDVIGRPAVSLDSSCHQLNRERGFSGARCAHDDSTPLRVKVKELTLVCVGHLNRQVTGCGGRETGNGHLGTITRGCVTVRVSLTLALSRRRGGVIWLQH